MSFFSPVRQLADPKRPMTMNRMWVWVTVILVLDQVSKWLAVMFLSGKTSLVLVPGLLNLHYRVNTGAAFSLLSDRTGLLAAFSALISVGLVVWAWRLKPGELGLRRALGLVLGGALGNLVDRVLLGHVIDFIDAHWFWKAHWPTFNIADTAVCIGVGLLMLSSFMVEEPSPANPTQDKAAPNSKTKEAQHSRS